MVGYFYYIILRLEVNYVSIQDGRASYLSDCTHEYAGMILDLPQLKNWPEDLRLWEE